MEAAEKVVGRLLQPLDDEMNDHKQKQLRELALINGTLREEEYCHVCGEKGHRAFECPTRQSKYAPPCIFSDSTRFIPPMNGG